MATHSSILAWRIPMDRGTCRTISAKGRKELDTRLKQFNMNVKLQQLHLHHSTSSVLLSFFQLPYLARALSCIPFLQNMGEGLLN